MENVEIISTVNLNGHVIHSSTSKPNSPAPRAVNAPGPISRLEPQHPSASQAWLEQCKTIISEQEKATETIHTLHDEVERLRDEVSVKNEDQTRHTKRIGDLEKQLVEKNSELESMKTRLIELLRLNEDLGTKNRELENFRAGLELYLHASKRHQPVDQGGSIANPETVANPGAQFPPQTTVVPAVNDHPPAVMNQGGVLLAAPVIEQNLSAQEMIDDMPPELPIMEAHSPESASLNPLDTSVNSTASTSDDSMENHNLSITEPNSMDSDMPSVADDVKSEVIGEMIQPESPELVRPKKRVTFSPNLTETFPLFPPLTTAGKRKRAESMVTTNTCKMCMVSYDSLTELRGHACPLRLYECSYGGCGKTFGTSYGKKRHEKTHAEKEELAKAHRID